MQRCAWCRRRGIVTDSTGRQATHSPHDLEVTYPVAARCPGSGTAPVDRLSETVDWHQLMT
jgi:hypothetical protein